MNNDDKHTPGPWAVEKVMRTERYILKPWSGTSPHSTLLATLQGNPAGSLDADARLIAAAPDLLAALTIILPLAGAGAVAALLYDGPVNDHKADAAQRALRNAEAAIAKATGAESERSNGCKLSDDSCRK